ncbi:protein CHAPERONE-LIKE PROTEIN OF POR1, chloroplastic isoform X2 [Primulina eburnea]|uniref:protein CHAPERONE-LIKE PROTEIN OF POR1, chloroplastic isoform X2 n=1 Tax=Primulina eburnea TaxID=1245227 RepID=UPI003C6C1DB2
MMIMNESFLLRFHLVKFQMASSGLTYSPLRYSLYVPTSGSGPHNKKVTSLPNIGRSKDPLCLQRNVLDGSTWRYKQHHTLVKCAMDASFGDLTNGSNAIFPRINVKDPYKRLGISKEASEEEIQAARNFLIQTYGGDKNSVDAIESAHDKIIMQKFYERKNPKINIKKKAREVTQSRYVQAVTTRFRTPATSFIIKTSVAFIVLGVLTLLFPTEEGPTLQVGISLIVTTYFIFDRLKSKLRALLYGVGTFALSWLVGTFLMVSVMPPILKGPRSLEVTTSLISYIFLWVSSTYLR